MKLTNKQNLPATFVKAVERIQSRYSRGKSDYSASQLTDPPRLVHLKNRHEDELEMDVADAVWMAFGTAFHLLMSGSTLDEVISEERYFEKIAERVLSGAPDAYDKTTGTLTDYKVTSAYTRKNKSRIDEWEAQVNVYAWLMTKKKHAVNAVQVQVFYRDWSPTEKKRNPDTYPDHKTEILPMKLWPEDDTEAFIIGRLELLKLSEGLSDKNLPLCSDEDTWAKPECWAVKNEGVNKARKLYQNQEAAEAHVANAKPKKGDKLYVEYRPAEFPRCEAYCPVSEICSQYQSVLKKRGV